MAFQKGYIPWNKGLTKETDERVARAAENMEGRIPWNKDKTKETDPRIEEVWKTRKENDPQDLAIKKTVVTRQELYGSVGVRNPKEFAEKVRRGVKRFYEKAAPEWWEQFSKNVSIGTKRFWDNLSPIEKANYLKNSFFKGSRNPNISESRLIPMLEPLGFGYNGKGPVIINGYVPDFVHTLDETLLVEFDGEGGHRPDLISHLPRNKAELDNQRDRAYQEAGYRVLRILPEHLKLGREFIQEMVREWMEVNT